jgi:hypothetical protein
MRPLLNLALMTFFFLATEAKAQEMDTPAKTESAPIAAIAPQAPGYHWGPVFSFGLRGFGVALDGRTPGRMFGFGLMYGGWPTVRIPQSILKTAKSKSAEVTTASFKYRRIETHGRWHPFSHPAFRGVYLGPGLERRTMDGTANLRFTDADTSTQSNGTYSVKVTSWFLGNKFGILHHCGSGFVLGTEINYRYLLSTAVSVSSGGNASLHPVAQKAIEYVIGEYGISSGFNWTIAQMGWYF